MQFTIAVTVAAINEENNLTDFQQEYFSMSGYLPTPEEILGTPMEQGLKDEIWKAFIRAYLIMKAKENSNVQKNVQTDSDSDNPR